MKTMQKYKIDRNRLHKLIEKAGLRPTEFSESAGYNRSWLTKQIHDGEISRPAMVALEAAGIRYEEYMLLSPERGGASVQPEPPAEKPAGLTADELYDIIFRAVRDALKA